MILIPLQKLPKNVGDLDKLIVTKGFKNGPKSNKSPNLVTLKPTYQPIYRANSARQNVCSRAEKNFFSLSITSLLGT